METDKSDLGNTGNDDNVGLTKAKKPRKPMSEASRQNLLNGQKKRLENIQKRKEERLVEAQRALLEKEGYVKKVEAPQPVKAVAVEAKPKKQAKEVFKNTVLVEEPAEPLEEAPAPARRAKPAKKATKAKPVITYQEEESSSEGETESEESQSEDEVIIIKKKRKSGRRAKTSAEPIQIPTKKSVRITNDSLGQNWRDFFV
jgi:hypothetical protein